MTKPAEAKDPAKWQLIRDAYEGTDETISEIARRYGVPRGQVLRAIKRNDWDRDKKFKIPQSEFEVVELRRQAVNPRIVQQAPVRTQVQEVWGMLAEHNADAKVLRQIGGLLQKDLMEYAQARATLEELIMEYTETDKTQHQQQHMMRAVSLPTHIQCFLRLAQGFEKAHALERSSLGVKTDAQIPTGGDEEAKPEQLSGPEVMDDKLKEWEENMKQYQKVAAEDAKIVN